MFKLALVCAFCYSYGYFEMTIHESIGMYHYLIPMIFGYFFDNIYATIRR